VTTRKIASSTRRDFLRRSALLLPASAAILGGSAALTNPASAQSDTFGVPPPAGISAQAVYAIDSASGAVLYSLNATTQRPIASITKCVTALTVIQAANAGRITLDDLVTIEDDDQVQPAYSTLGARVGDQISVSGLLEGLLIPSGGDCANALARYVGGKLAKQTDPDASRAAFVSAMNDYVQNSLHLKNTNFTDAAGDDDNSGYSTAVDLMQVGIRLMADPTLKWIVAQPATSVPSTNGDPYVLPNTNDFVSGKNPLSGVVGIKTGSTSAAGASLLVARDVNNGSTTVIMAVLGSTIVYDGDGTITTDARYDDTKAIFADMDSRFTWNTADQVQTLFPDLKDQLSVWGVEFKDPPVLPIATGAKDKPTCQLVLGKATGAGKQAGSVEFYSGSDVTGSIPVYQVGG
jgi:D-alanyl-D-alanine carboxypeptidase